MKAAYPFFILITITLMVISCDIAKPQKSFRLAVPENDYHYNRMSSHLKSFLENNGYKIDIVKAGTSIDANRMVARGEADITFINNHSNTISQELGSESGRLRTIMPLATRLFLAFSKNQ